MSEPILRAEDLRISFGGVMAADGVSVEIHPSEFLAIVGPNGSGKTTFLNICTGYVKPSHGTVWFEGRNITRLTPRRITRRGIARAFQIPQLFTDQTLAGNLMLSIAARRGIWDAFFPLDRNDYRSEALDLLELVGLSDAADKPAGHLPEGMRKLADIAIALALRPRLLLLDEPTSGISATEKYGLMERLIQVLRGQNVTALFVEHDMEIVRRYADRVVVWDSGRVVASGQPDDVLTDPKVLRNVVGVA